jgi:pimeloyl-ACP methyl ester carboxylesterase
VLCCVVALNTRFAQYNNGTPTAAFRRTTVVPLSLFAVLTGMGVFAVIAAFGIGAGPSTAEVALWFVNITAAALLAGVVLGQNLMYLEKNKVSDDETLVAGTHDSQSKASENPVFDASALEAGNMDTSGAISGGFSCGRCCASCCWITLAVLGVLMCWEAIAFTNDYNTYYPGDEVFVEVDGHKVQTLCMGTYNPDLPPVLLVHGLSGSHMDWSWVQPAVAEKTLVCSYSRSGYAYSERGASPRTSPQIASEMREVVAGLGFDKPEFGAGILLVGHSFAGHNMRYFAAKNPELVKGIVFVDAVSAETTAELTTSGGCDADVTRSRFLQDLGRVIGPLGLMRVVTSFSLISMFDEFKVLPEDVQGPYFARVQRQKFFETWGEEGALFPQSCYSVLSLPEEEKVMNFPVLSIGASRGIHWWGKDDDPRTYKAVEDITKFSNDSSFAIINGTHSGIFFREEPAKILTQYVFGMLEKLRASNVEV